MYSVQPVSNVVGPIENEITFKLENVNKKLELIDNNIRSSSSSSSRNGSKDLFLFNYVFI